MSALAAAWEVLETEAGHAADVGDVRTIDTGVAVAAGNVKVGVDGEGRRHLLIPLLPGEGVAEDRAGRGVHVLRVNLDGVATVSIVCTSPALNDVFERLAQEILSELHDAESPANRAVEVLNRWKELLAAALNRGVLNDEQLVGLIAELLCAYEIASRDELRRLDSWTGPTGHQHDFFCDDLGVEVKATLTREGRRVGITSIDQLDEAPGSGLFLAYHRFQPAAARGGESLMEVVDRLKALGVDASGLSRKLAAVGVAPQFDDYYRGRRFVLEERRVYDVLQPFFPRLIRSSFVGGALPPGIAAFRYSIDLTNEPPTPLAEDAVIDLWVRCAR